MRPIKITAFVALTAITASLFVLSFTPRAQGERIQVGPAESGPITANFVGIGGMTFQQGQNVGIAWILRGEGVKYFESNNWAECELYFSADGGQTWTRITPELNISRRSYEWTMPNVLTRQGVIAIRLGIQGEGEYYFFQSEPFRIGRRLQ